MLPVNSKTELNSIVLTVKTNDPGEYDALRIVKGKYDVRIINNSLRGIVVPQHLYILSDDKIKEGEWYLNVPTNKIEQATSSISKKYCPFPYSKIIASTDSSLKLNNPNHGGYNMPLQTGIFPRIFPFVPQSFIDKYISEYNKGNKIEEVMVEYMIDTVGCIQTEGINAGLMKDILKLNPDNTINIKSIKDSWTRDEVTELLIKLWQSYGVINSGNDFDDWINSNL